MPPPWQEYTSHGRGVSAGRAAPRLLFLVAGAAALTASHRAFAGTLSSAALRIVGGQQRDLGVQRAVFKWKTESEIMRIEKMRELDEDRKLEVMGKHKGMTDEELGAEATKARRAQLVYRLEQFRRRDPSTEDLVLEEFRLANAEKLLRRRRRAKEMDMKRARMEKEAEEEIPGPLTKKKCIEFLEEDLDVKEALGRIAHEQRIKSLVDELYDNDDMDDKQKQMIRDEDYKMYGKPGQAAKWIRTLTDRRDGFGKWCQWNWITDERVKATGSYVYEGGQTDEERRVLLTRLQHAKIRTPFQLGKKMYFYDEKYEKGKNKDELDEGMMKQNLTSWNGAERFGNVNFGLRKEVVSKYPEGIAGPLSWAKFRRGELWEETQKTPEWREYIKHKPQEGPKNPKGMRRHTRRYGKWVPKKVLF